jgi:hypothetical protein
MPAPDEARAASLLAGYLLATGWTVRLADAGGWWRRAVATKLIRLEPVLDAAGLDRVIVSRSWRGYRGCDATRRSRLSRWS